jgi:hypothetical protein
MSSFTRLVDVILFGNRPGDEVSEHDDLSV